MNERTADYLGLPKDHPLRFGTATGADWDSHIPLLHPDDREETRRVWSNCLRTGCAGEVTFRVRNAEGGYRWFLNCVEPIRAADRTLLYWIGLNLDIEERKQAEFYIGEGQRHERLTQELQRREAYLAEAQRLSHTGSFGWNVSTDEHFWSDETSRIFEFAPASKLSLQMILDRVHPNDFEEKQLTPRRSIVKQRVGSVKTQKSKNPVPLDDDLIEELLAWRRETPYAENSDYVFAGPRMKGRQPYWLSRIMQRHIKPAAAEAGIAIQGWHTLRRSYTTLLRQNNDDPKVVQALLRHNSIKVTMDVYDEAMPDEKQIAHQKVLRLVTRKQDRTVIRTASETGVSAST